jgi:tRNA threonylcarbamoyladenosine biosynthesis protein TsaB
MILIIDTSDKKYLSIALSEELPLEGVISRLPVDRNQAEKLIPAIEDILLANKISAEDINKIAVVNHGGSFTSLRIGVITANALAYAWNIPVVAIDSFSSRKELSGQVKKFSHHYLVEPAYDSDPQIGKLKSIL